MLNLSMLASYDDEVCVRCRSEDEARRFTSEMKLQYPNRCKAWFEGETCWDRCEERGYIDYFPCFNKSEDSGWGLCWDDDDYAESKGCAIVEFRDIPDVLNLDLGEIQASDFTIDNLFS